jgi:hypothetical protein
MKILVIDPVCRGRGHVRVIMTAEIDGLIGRDCRSR